MQRHFARDNFIPLHVHQQNQTLKRLGMRSNLLRVGGGGMRVQRWGGFASIFVVHFPYSLHHHPRFHIKIIYSLKNVSNALVILLPVSTTT